MESFAKASSTAAATVARAFSKGSTGGMKVGGVIPNWVVL